MSWRISQRVLVLRGPTEQQQSFPFNCSQFRQLLPPVPYRLVHVNTDTPFSKAWSGHRSSSRETNYAMPSIADGSPIERDFMLRLYKRLCPMLSAPVKAPILTV